MKKQLIITSILFILSASLVLGAFDVKSTAIKKDIFLSESAEFNVTITNNAKIDDVFSFSTQDPAWILLIGQIPVSANTQRTIKFTLDPDINIDLGIHAVPVKVKSLRTNEIQTEIFVVNVRPYDPIFGEYRPSVQFIATVDKKINPRNKIPIEVYMKNRNVLDIGEMRIIISSSLFEDDIVTTLGPQEEKRTEYLYALDPLQKPGIYTVDLQLKVKNVTIASSRQNFEVEGYATISTKKTEKNFLFKKDETITLENVGNAEKTTKVNLDTNWFEKLFTNSDPEYASVKAADGTNNFEWTVSIKPQELITINVTTNYRTPIVILLLIIVIIILYFVYRSPVIISKEAVIAKGSNSEVEHLKIKLLIKNRTRNVVERVAVIDRVPGLAEFIKKKTLGTLEPNKVTKRENKGTILKWNLNNLEAFEERIITYEIKSKLKIIGNISLPSLRTNFLSKNKERTVYSNKVLVGN